MKFFAYAFFLISCACCIPAPAAAQSNPNNTNQSAILAARQADRAALQACLRRGQQPGISNAEMLQIRQECMHHANENVGAIRMQELANDPSVYGRTVTAMIAAKKEETADPQKAVEIYKAIDKRTDEILREAARLTQAPSVSLLSPFDVQVDQKNTPERNQDIMKGQALILTLMGVRRAIAALDEQLGRRDEAAQYRRTSQELTDAQKERVAKLDAAARKAAIEIFKSALTSPYCTISNFGSFGGRINCYAPGEDKDTQALVHTLDSME